MVRTAEKGSRVSGGKAPRKQNPTNRPQSSTNKTSGTADRSTGGQNTIQTQPIPEWQQPITNFYFKVDKVLVQADSNMEGAESPANHSNSCSDNLIAHADNEDGVDINISDDTTVKLQSDETGEGKAANATTVSTISSTEQNKTVTNVICGHTTKSSAAVVQEVDVDMDKLGVLWCSESNKENASPTSSFTCNPMKRETTSDEKSKTDHEPSSKRMKMDTDMFKHFEDMEC